MRKKVVYLEIERMRGSVQFIENMFVLEGIFSLDNRAKRPYIAISTHIRTDKAFNKYGLFSLEDAFILLYHCP